MNWTRLDFPTRAGLVATVMAVVGVLIPPLSMVAACIAIAFSGTAVRRARRHGQPNPVALCCCVVSVALVAVLVVGSTIYSATNG